MGRIAVKIVSDGANTSGGRADSMMLTQYASDVVRVPDDIAASECSGGILPITQAEYDLLGLATARDTADAVISALTPAAWYRNATGVTSAGGFASQWDDYSGNGRHLVQGTGTNQPAYANGVISLDGADNFMKTGAFTLNQPITYYIVFSQGSWTASDTVLDGNASTSNWFYQNTATPNLATFAGTAGINSNPDLAIGSYGIFALVFNNASSSVRLNDNAAVTGTVGTSNAGAITLGRLGGSASNYGHINVKELIAFAAAHDDTTQSSVITALNNALTVF